MLKRFFMIAALALTVSGPAFASAKAEDCKGMLNGASVLIGIAEMINDEYKRNAGDPKNKDQERLNELREQFRTVTNNFLSLKAEYSRIPCGSGDIEEDLGQRFPELGKVFE